MGKLIIILLLLSQSIPQLSSAQNTPTEEKDFVPKITLPSPEAFSFTRYGDIPVGLFTGSMNFSIPLFNVSSGKIKIPVSLAYTSNGIKVDAVSGRTGMDWNLKLGGVITRNIMGRPDDMSALVSLPPQDSSSWDFYNFVKTSGTLDLNTQPDEYTYSFLGQTGKFYFDYAGAIRELTPSGNKITYGSFNFQITGVDGTKYYFTHFEDSYNYSFYGDNNALNNSYGGWTAWYLTKIKNLYGDSIVYNYQYVNSIESPISYLSGINQTYRGVGNGPGLETAINAHYFRGSNCAPFGDLNYLQFAGNISAAGLNTDLRLTTMNVAKVTSVDFKGGRLQLYYSSRDDLPGEEKLDSIDLFSTITNARIQTIGLEYIYSQSTGYNTPTPMAYPSGDTLQIAYPYLRKRLYLEKVRFFNQDKTSNNFYNFNYEGLNDLPPRLSFAQDYFGYFNGKTNISMLPEHTIFANKTPLMYTTSNRSVDTNYSKKGVLTMITYPTGGFSQIEYQSNYVPNYVGYDEIFDTLELNLNFPTTGYDEYSQEFDFDLNEVPYLIKLSAEWITPPDYNGPLEDSFVVFRVYDEFNNSVLLSNGYYDFIVQPGAPVSITDQLRVLNRSANYRLYLEGGNTNVRAKAQLIKLRYVTNSLTQSPISGIRVARIRNYTDAGKQVSFKKFDYLKPNGESSGGAVLRFLDGADFSYLERGLVGNQFMGNYVLSSTGFFGNYVNDYGSINYEYATETFDSLGSGGALTTQFQMASNTIATTFGCIQGDSVGDFSPFLIPNAPTTNTGYMAGKELKKTWYRKDGTQMKKVQELSNHYSVDTRLYHVDSFYLIKEAIRRTERATLWRYFNDFDVNEYKRISAWVHLDSTVQKQYDVFDREMKNKTVYNYANPSHMLATEVWQLDSKGDTSKTISQYIDDMRLLNPGNAVLGGMYTANIINALVKKQTYTNSTLLATSLINYNSSFLPDSLKTSRYSAPLETDAVITQYDALGNPLEFKKRDQPSAMLFDTATGDMIAGCQNAVLSDLAYTSFETGYGGTWSGINQSSIQASGGITGNKFYNQTSFSLSKSGLGSGNYYYVSYWSKNGAYTVGGTQSGYPKTLNNITYGAVTWTLYEHLVTGQTSISVSGTGAIDELRLYPRGAMLTTYAFAPLLRMQTACDANNRISYYEYDGFGRLQRIRDQYHNILKTYDYKYASQ